MLPAKRPENHFVDPRKLCAIGLTVLSVSACASIPPSSTTMPIGTKTRAPSGLVALCTSAPEVCEPDKGGRMFERLANIDRDDATGSIAFDGSAPEVTAASSLKLRARYKTTGLDENGFFAPKNQQSLPIHSFETENPHLKRLNTNPAVDAKLVSISRAIPHPRLDDAQEFAINTLLAANGHRGIGSNHSPLLNVQALTNTANDQVARPEGGLKEVDWTTIVRGIVEKETAPFTGSPERPSNLRARAGQTALDLTPARFAELDSINRKINAQIKPVTDLDEYGYGEVWTLPLTFKISRNGDCEDYAMEKRQALLKAGFPASSMYLAVAYSKQTGKHALLVISTNSGDYVLDNMTSEIKPWFQTGYAWISRQSSEDPLNWASVNS